MVIELCRKSIFADYPQYLKYLSPEESIEKSLSEDSRRWNLGIYLQSRGRNEVEDYLSIDERTSIEHTRNDEIIDVSYDLFKFFLLNSCDELPKELANSISKYKNLSASRGEITDETAIEVKYYENKIIYLLSWMAQNIVDLNEINTLRRNIYSLRSKLWGKGLARNIVRRYLPILFVTSMGLSLLFGCSGHPIIETPAVVTEVPSTPEICQIIKEGEISRIIDPGGETVFTFQCVDGTARMVLGYNSPEVEHLYLSKSNNLQHLFDPQINNMEIRMVHGGDRFRFNTYNLTDDFNEGLGISRALSFVSSRFTLANENIGDVGIDVTIGNSTVDSDNRFGDIYLFDWGNDYPKSANDVLKDNWSELGSIVPVGSDGSICYSPMLGTWLVRIDPHNFVKFSQIIKQRGLLNENIPNTQVAGEALLVNELVGIFIGRYEASRTSGQQQMVKFIEELGSVFQSESSIFYFPSDPNSYLAFFKSFINTHPEYIDIYNRIGIPVRDVMQLDEVWINGEPFKYSRDLEVAGLQQKIYEMFFASLKEAVTTELMYEYLRSNN